MVSSPAEGDMFTRIEQYLVGALQGLRLPGLAAAIVQGKRVIYLSGFGKADPTGRPVTPQTPFIIGSLSKSFTALAIMQLVEAGRIELDAPVQRYLPWFRIQDGTASFKAPKGYNSYINYRLAKDLILGQNNDSLEREGSNRKERIQ